MPEALASGHPKVFHYRANVTPPWMKCVEGEPRSGRQKGTARRANVFGLRRLHNRQMPNIAAVLKSEIARVSRKEVRSETESLRKVVTGYRSEIAALKRRTQALEQQIRSLSKAGGRQPKAQAEPAAKPKRFSAKGLATQRRRLGLSAEDLGRLLGTSGQSVYNWEQGKARPRAVHMQTIAALKTLKKTDAATHLASRETPGT